MARERVFYKSVVDRGIRPKHERKARVYVTLESVGSDFVQLRVRVGLKASGRRGYSWPVEAGSVSVKNDRVRAGGD